ncbi:hypothetical protein [Mesoterricola silvestris]|uniref:Outer membrane protein beta-barrel domain-containing protein n=1 Tax=Mesoterricola silvestris TaxID=2927979 RepID=A0AA48GKK6_9BACT|nr:hypothetical protein [Mesoterricola silvestris]BDU74771.1 hypothetical protein METEAL_39450 [Mesoterricola silvestris]
MHNPSRSLALAAMLACSLSAQSPWGFGAKFGVAPTVGTPGEQRNRGSVLCAFQGERRLAGRGTVFAELTYRYYRSVQFEATRFGTGFAPDGTAGQITKWAFDTAAGLPRADGRYDSVDIRKSMLEGMGLQVGYRHPLGRSIWSLQAGVALNALKSTQEVIGSLKVVRNREAATPTVLATEGMLQSVSTSSLRPGCFTGVRGDLASNLFVECNLSLATFAEVNYLPSSYTGRPAATESRNRTKTSLEFNAGLRF